MDTTPPLDLASTPTRLSTLAPTIRSANGALVFTETVRAANHAINRLDTELGIEIITGDKISVRYVDNRFVTDSREISIELR